MAIGHIISWYEQKGIENACIFRKSFASFCLGLVRGAEQAMMELDTVKHNNDEYKRPLVRK